MEANELSNTLGSISIACWMIVYTPQIVENYRLKSGDGLSTSFVVIWLLGDLCNLLGATLAHLLPTVIILAAYYSLCDIILLCQICYYRSVREFSADQGQITSSEEEPLLRTGTGGEDRQAKAASVRTVVLRYTGAITFVIAVGVTARLLSKGLYDEKVKPRRPSAPMAWSIQVIGWTGCAFYLGARIPQIVKNFKTRCEGLSPALFLFALFGNIAYVSSICAASMEREYLIRNSSWLTGSGFTMFMDFFVLCQFVYYRAVSKHTIETVEDC